MYANNVVIDLLYRTLAFPPIFIVFVQSVSALYLKVNRLHTYMLTY